MSANDFWESYNGEREALGMALVMHDPYDQFAWCQEWRFAIADVLTHDRHETVPGFRPGFNGADVESYAYQDIATSPPSDDALWYALKILDRYREWLRLAGEDY